MLRNLVLFTMALFILPTVIGATNVSVGVQTNGGDADIHTYSNTGNGTTNYYLNDKHLDNKMNNLRNDINSDKDILDTISEVFIQHKYLEGWVEVNKTELHNYQRRFRDVLENTFVTWNSLRDIYSQQQNEIQQLRFEVEALKKLYSGEEICKARMQVANEHEGINKITCGNTTYHSQGGGFVGFEN